MSPSALYLARAGRHSCYDRVVFDVNGSEAVGFAASYVPVVRADASGQPVRTAGNAFLELVVRAPIDDGTGHQPWRVSPRIGDAMVPAGTIAGYPSLRAVAFAGSFEGQTTVALGIREKRPFRVWSYGAQGYQHVIVDIAH
jgi:hypothetical protein